MKEEDKKFLDDNRFHYDILVKAFYIRNLSGATRENMQRIMSDYFRPGYTAELYCGSCVSRMVLDLYRHYDEWLRNNPEPVIIEPITIKANFPKHEKHHHRKTNPK